MLSWLGFVWPLRLGTLNVGLCRKCLVIINNILYRHQPIEEEASRTKMGVPTTRTSLLGACSFVGFVKSETWEVWPYPAVAAAKLAAVIHQLNPCQKHEAAEGFAGGLTKVWPSGPGRTKRKASRFQILVVGVCERFLYVSVQKKIELIYKSVSGATTQRLPTTRFRVSIPNPFQGLDLKAKHTVSIHKSFLRAGTQDLEDLQVHGEQQHFGCLPIVSERFRSKCFAFLS